jgi:hypothetical protein
MPLRPLGAYQLLLGWLLKAAYRTVLPPVTSIWLLPTVHPLLVLLAHRGSTGLFQLMLPRAATLSGFRQLGITLTKANTSAMALALARLPSSGFLLVVTVAFSGD